jgi:hypothetical protein
VSPRKAPRFQHCIDSVGGPVVDETVDRVSASATSATAPRQAIRAELIGADCCAALGFIARGYSPTLALCRELVAAGCDPATPLDAYRGDVLCLRVRAIGEAAGLTIEDDWHGRPRLRRWRERRCGAASAVAQTPDGCMDAGFRGTAIRRGVP